MGFNASQRTRKTRVSRLLRMSLPELVCRSKQEAFKWTERIRPPAAHAARVSPQCSLDQFVDDGEDHFFRGVFDRQVPAALAIGVPHHCKELVAAANKICRGRFDLLGYSNLDFGNPPDWRLDPISGCRAPLAHWTQVDPLNNTVTGDSKVIWELNRHQWLVHLGQAYRVTREERYAEAVVRYLRSWHDSNPPGMGINWTSSLEVSFRLIAWCWALYLIRDSEALTPSLFAELTGCVQSHATHVERYLSYYFSPNTHLTGEALGLLYAGVVFPALRHAERWRLLARKILVEELERQVLPDGVYFERSTCYQRYTIDIYLHFLILGTRAGLDVPPVVRKRLRSMLDFLVMLQHPDGSMPSIGDADGGWLLPLSRTRPEDFRPMFSTAAVLFEDPVYAHAAQGLAPDTLWLLGTSAAGIFETMQLRLPDADPCRVFEAGGFAIMRSGWDRNSHSLIFDAGSLGAPVSGAHGHADMLSIQCAVFGRPYIVDAGTCCYTANEELRDFSRSTAAHSTVVVDGKSQAEPLGPFSWQTRSKAQLRRWLSNQVLSFADAEHDGYGTLPDPVLHRRKVIFVKPRYWVLLDDLTGTKNHRVEIRFQFAPMDVRIDSNGWVRASLDGRQGLLMQRFSSTPFEAEVRTGCQAPLEGWVSPNYGQLEPAPIVVYTASLPLPACIVTLLWPTENVQEETPTVKFVQRDGDSVGLMLPDLGEIVLFEDGDAAVERIPRRLQGDLVTNHVRNCRHYQL